MITHICDRCGRPIFKEELRFTVKIQVYAAADPLEVDLDDLMQDHRKQIEEILERCEHLTEEELMRDVWTEYQFDICHPCQRAFLADPLACRSV